jgi:nitrogen fixation-related uncharacterized protein
MLGAASGLFLSILAVHSWVCIFAKVYFIFLVPAWGVFWGGRSSQFDRFCAMARQSSCREMPP